MAETIIINVETERLILRNLELSDVSQDYANWLNDPEINKYLSCANRFQTVESCLAYVQSYQQRNDMALIGMFLKENGLHIGNLTFSSIDWQAKSVAIGVSIGKKEYMSKGLASESLSALVTYCFDQMQATRLWAGINVNNTACCNLYKRCGFEIETVLPKSDNINGELQDAYVVSLSKERYISKI